MNTLKLFNDEKLRKIVGGDYGDIRWADTKEDVKFRYNVGDWVEVYDSFWHICTTRYQIIMRYAQRGGFSSTIFNKKYCAVYKVTRVLGDYGSGMAEFRYVEESDIQSS